MSQIEVSNGVAAGPKGIGGWLILPMLGLFATLLSGVLLLREQISLPDLSYLTLGQVAFIGVEIAVNIIITIIAPIILLILLFKRSQAFPRLYAFWAVAGLAFIGVDLLMAYLLFGEALAASGQELIDRETMREIVQAVTVVVIWVPYMLNSRRVANTFTR